MKRLIMITAILLLALMSGCGQVTSIPAAAPTTDADSATVLIPTPIAEAVADVADAEATTEAVTSEVTEADAATTESHPVEQLIASFTDAAQANGDVLVLYGQVLDVNANPLPDTVVEIWQTDASGVYDHPGDSGTAGRDTTFQFYGSTATDVDGWYAFRTIVPGRYEPRPRHIHFKVKQNGNTLLTSQFYFSDDIAEVEGESMFRAVGESGDRLLLQLVQGEGMLLANGQIVLDAGTSANSGANTDTGTLPLTPSQAEGPYYPLVALADHDNDLLVLE